MKERNQYNRCNEVPCIFSHKHHNQMVSLSCGPSAVSLRKPTKRFRIKQTASFAGVSHEWLFTHDAGALVSFQTLWLSPASGPLSSKGFCQSSTSSLISVSEESGGLVSVFCCKLIFGSEYWSGSERSQSSVSLSSWFEPLLLSFL